MKRILLITIGLSLSLFAEFTRDDSTQIVTDSTMHLQWQDNADAKTVEKKWTEAINYCEGLNLGGHTDWRLPNINELKSIVDRSKEDPAIVTAFKNISSSSSYYWSSTTLEGHKGYAWDVIFYSGSVYGNYKDNNYHARCVRGRQ